MAESQAAIETQPAILPHPPGFRARRGLNWGFLGLLYTSYYMCRYNLPIANVRISDEFHFSHAQMGWIISTQFLCYGFGQIINGLLTDRIGGKRAMLIGAAGTIAMNILFGVASIWGMLGLFIAIRGVDGYFQAFGAPGMIKINTAWFGKRERGRFAGIYGFMINLGRFGIGKIGPMILAGFVLFGMVKIPPAHWKWLFWIPSCICAVVAVCMALIVKETPEEAGFHGVHSDASDNVQDNTRTDFVTVIKKIALHPTIWIVAMAYSCTGVVRQSVDQWWIADLHQQFHVADADQFFIFFGLKIPFNPIVFISFLIPFVASSGSLISGYVSDIFFKGRRAPVASFLYFLESAVILTAAQFHTFSTGILFLILISLTVNSTHSIVGTAAAMDIGGRKMAGFTSGLIDSFQYFGATLSGFVLGQLLDKDWAYYFYFMAPFGIIGGILMMVPQRTPPQIATIGGVIGFLLGYPVLCAASRLAYAFHLAGAGDWLRLPSVADVVMDRGLAMHVLATCFGLCAILAVAGFIAGTRSDAAKSEGPAVI